MRFFQDLYRDLRDKRLLPLVVALIAAIVAVPLLLGGDEAPPPPTAESSAIVGATDDAPEARAVVVEQPPEIRQFEKRLEDFQSKNPFKQQFTGPSKAEESASKELQDTSKQGGGGGGGGGGGQTETITENFIYTYEVDATVSVVGEKKKDKKKGVKSLSFLPSPKKPLVQFIRADFEATEAYFIVSRNVNKTFGDGACKPDNDTCEFLLMREGDEHRFEYEPDGRTYRIKLTKITRIKESVDGGGGESQAAKSFEKLSGTIRGK